MTKHYLISGRVQGVGFRAFVERMALALDIRGWVRNLSDGRVEAMAQGSAAALEKFEAQLRVGPSRSHVENVQIEDRSESEQFVGFSVRKDGASPC